MHNASDSATDHPGPQTTLGRSPVVVIAALGGVGLANYLVAKPGA